MARQGTSYAAVVRTAREWQRKTIYALHAAIVFDEADLGNRLAAVMTAEEHLADVLAWDSDE